MRLCMCIMRSKCWGGVFDEPIKPVEPPVEKPEPPVDPPVEEPEEPTTPPSTEDLLTIKIEDEIMAVVGTNTWNAIAYGNGKYVAVGESGYITTSTDGVNWTTPKQIISSSMYHDIHSIQYGNGVFVTCGEHKIAYSINGDDWTLISPFVSYGNQYFDKVAYKNGTFVANFSNKCFSSADGKTWNDGVSCGLFSINTLISTGNEFMAFYDRKIATSPDGITWTTSATSVPTSVHGIAVGNGLIIATFARNVYVSTDGISCELIKLQNVSGYMCVSSCITFNNGLFVITGQMQSNANSSQYATYAATSTDGKTWTEWVHVKDPNGQELQNRIFAMIVMP